jgi:hypothetical protein
LGASGGSSIGSSNGISSGRGSWSALTAVISISLFLFNAGCKQVLLSGTKDKFILLNNTEEYFDFITRHWLL